MGCHNCFSSSNACRTTLNLSPRLDSTISLIYLGVFPTGIAWLLRFSILKKKWISFSGSSSIFNSNIWGNFRIYFFKRINYA